MSGEIQRCIEFVKQTSSLALELELPDFVPTICRTFVLEMAKYGIETIRGESW